MLKPQPRYLYHHQYHQTPELTTHPSTSPYAHVPHILINPPPPLPTPPPYPEKAYHPHPLPHHQRANFGPRNHAAPSLPSLPCRPASFRTQHVRHPASTYGYGNCMERVLLTWLWGGGIWYLDAIAIYTHIYIFATPCPRPCSWGVYSVPACAR